VPQGSVLGPLLFLIFINDIDNGIASKILKFSDDTKLYGQVGTAKDIGKLRNDVEKLVGW
jgi:ribonuclease P/MRP protein subunit RPP40